jgi:Rad3-related DNA helicase
MAGFKPSIRTAEGKWICTFANHHKNLKGIIHTTSYEQLNFIKENVSKDNRRRLLETDPEIQQDEIIAEHINATKPTVLISPSLQLGLDFRSLPKSRTRVLVTDGLMKKERVPDDGILGKLYSLT